MTEVIITPRYKREGTGAGSVGGANFGGGGGATIDADSAKLAANNTFTRENTFESKVTINSALYLNGDLIQNGAAYETHAQHVFTANDFMTLRDGAVANLQDGAFTGFCSKKVFSDGSDGFLVFGSDGMARVGRQASLQMLATREDTPADGAIQYWNSANKRLTSGVQAGDLWHKGNLNRSDTDFTAKDIRFQSVRSDALVPFLTNKGGAQGIEIGKLLISDSYDDGFKVPEKGAWIKGEALFGNGIRSIDQNGAGFTASGWKIGDYSNLLNLDVRGRLMTYEFVQNKLSILNGNMIVSDRCKVVGVYSGNWWDCYYDKNEGCPFEIGDIVLSKTNGEHKLGRVVSKNDTGTFFIDKAGYTGNPPVAGDLFVRWNSDDINRKGLLYLNSSDTNAPNFQVIHDGQIRGCFGNCAGLNWQGAALPANSFGTWIENGWFSGSVNANSGKIGNATIDSNSLYLNSKYGSGGYGVGFFDEYKSLLAYANNSQYVQIKSSGIEQYNYGTYSFKVNNDGTGLLANGNIAWDAQGNVIFSDKVKLQWQSGGRNYISRFITYYHDTTGSYSDYIYSITGPNVGNDGSGLKIIDSLFINTIGANTNIVFQFKIKKLTGTLTSIGGHGTVLTNQRVYVDNVYVGNNFAGGLSSHSIDDGNYHSVVVYATTISAFNGDCNLYIQPNRNSGYNAACTVAIKDLQLETGSNKSDWTPPFEETENRLTKIDSNGIYTGTLTAEQIKANLADVGGFHISADKLTSKNLTLDSANDKITLYSPTLKGALAATIGSTSSGHGRMRNVCASFVNTTSSGCGFYAEGAIDRNSFLAGTTWGGITSNTFIQGYGLQIVYPDSDTSGTFLNLMYATKFCIRSLVNNGLVYLPRPSVVEDNFDIERNSNWAVEILIVCAHNANQDCYIKPFSSEYGGYMKGYDGQDISPINLGCGDSLLLLLCCENGTYYAQVLSHNS